MSNFKARSTFVCSTFLILVASSLTGKRQGVKTMAKLLASILLDSLDLATSDKNLRRQLKVAACNGGNKRLAVKMPSIFASPESLQHLKLRKLVLLHVII